MLAFRRIVRTQAAFAGIEVHTYCFLANHFHILARIDPEDPARSGDEILLARFRALYGIRRSPSLGVDASALEAALRENGTLAVELRRRLRARMGDASVFMREVKARFTAWYNARHGTVGTFWAERFRSVVVEERSRAARLMALYIDLNPVRAGLVTDPKDYRFCGFGESCAGNAAARRVIARIEGVVEWSQAVQDRYGARLRAAMEQRTARRTNPCEAMADAKEGMSTNQYQKKEPDPSTAHGIQLFSKIRVFGEGIAVGTRKWIAEICRADGPLGLKRDRRPTDLEPQEDGKEAISAARNRRF